MELDTAMRRGRMSGQYNCGLSAAACTPVRTQTVVRDGCGVEDMERETK